jgi:hypothetical protein
MTDQTVTVTVPFAIRKRGGRKLILTPDGTPASPPTRSRPDSALLKALARGFRWQKMLKEGNYQTLEEIAEAENINPSYLNLNKVKVKKQVQYRLEKNIFLLLVLKVHI